MKRVSPAAACGVAALAALAALAGCGGSGHVAGPSGEAAAAGAAPARPVLREAAVHGGWGEMARSPLSPRLGAAAVWTGGEVLVFGGLARDWCSTTMCPPLLGDQLADLERVDAAAYDPAHDNWRGIAGPPRRLRGGSPAVIGRNVYLLQQGYPRFYAYNLDRDAWRQLHGPPLRGGPDRIAAVGGKVFAWRANPYKGRAVNMLFDPARNTWTDVPGKSYRAAAKRSAVRPVPARRWADVHEVPGAPDDLRFPAVVAAGAALVVWGGGTARLARSPAHEDTISRGWIWRPRVLSRPDAASARSAAVP